MFTKDKTSSLSSSPKDSNDEIHAPPNHRRTNSFSSFAKAYKISKASKSSNKLKTGDEETQQLIAVLEHQVAEGDRSRREMTIEISKLKDQLHRAEAQIALLKQANSALHTQLATKSQPAPPSIVRLPSIRRTAVGVERSCMSDGYREQEDGDSHHFTKSCDADTHWGFETPTSDPLNTNIDNDDSESDSEFNISTIINTINMNTYNNINNIQVNNINEINYIIDINNINNITNYNTTTTINNVTTNNNIVNNINNSSGESYSAPIEGDSNSNSVVRFNDKEKRARMFSRTTTHHKRRGSDTESKLRLEERYQRRHSEGKVLRIAGIREQVRVAILQILNTNYAGTEDEWPSIHNLLQGIELLSPALPPPPRHLVHAGFVHEYDENEQDKEYWIEDTLLLHFKDFLLVACQPKSDTSKKYTYKEIVHLTPSSKVKNWTTPAEHFKDGFEIESDSCRRSFLVTTKEECDKWVSVINKHVGAVIVRAKSEECFQHYLISPCEGFIVEPTAVIPTGESKLSLEEPRKGIYHYQSFFYSKPHTNYVGGSSAWPVAISIEDKSARFALSPSMILRRSITDPSCLPEQDTVVHRVLIRTQSGDECVCIAVPAHMAKNTQTAHSEVIVQLAHALPTHILPVQLKIGTSIFKVKSPDLETELLNYEANNMRRCHKIGVVYCAKGTRTEAEMLATTKENASSDFAQFLSLLGTEVTLKGWSDYAGGLDVKHDSDGKQSIFTNFWGIPIMFHVSTLLPLDPHNPILSIS